MNGVQAQSWLLRAYEVLPIPPLATGILVGLLLLTAYLLYTWAIGSELGVLPENGIERGWGAELILGLLTGLAPAVTLYTLRGGLDDFEALRPLLGGSTEDLARTRVELTRLPVGVANLVALTIAIASSLLLVTEPGTWVTGARPPWTHPAVLWLLGRNTLNVWMVARSLVFEIALARSFSRLGERLIRVDLLDPSWLTPFRRRALRSVLLWMALLALFSLLYTGGWASALLPWGLASGALLAGVAFTLPLLGARRRIREEKARELARVRASMQDAREHVLAAARHPAAPPGRIADLVAWEHRIEGVHEWPLDTPTLLRFALYAGIGLGSWVGGALVERALDLALG